MSQVVAENNDEGTADVGETNVVDNLLLVVVVVVVVVGTKAVAKTTIALDGPGIHDDDPDPDEDSPMSTAITAVTNVDIHGNDDVETTILLLLLGFLLF